MGDGRTAKAVSLGNSHTCAILDDDSLKCWGDNSHGGLGDGTTFKKYVPVAVNLGAGRTAKAVSAGSGWNGHTCAILDDDSLKCWGNNMNGELGTGNLNDEDCDNHPDRDYACKKTPTAVNLGASRTAKAVSLGAQHTCAILDDDSLKCWGYNGSGELGDGTNTNRTTPTAVDLGAGRTAKAVSLGSSHTCAILDDDSLKCWGDNDYIHFDGTSDDRNSPTSIDLGVGRTAKAVSLGVHHTCAILDNDLAKCWGSSHSSHDYHQRGASHTIDVEGTDIIYLGSWDGNIPTANAISAGYYHTCAILDDDSLKCWGHNQYWQLGTGSRRNDLCQSNVSCRSEPTTVDLGS